MQLLHEEVGSILANLPFWSRLTWNVTPLQSYRSTIDRDRQRYYVLAINKQIWPMGKVGEYGARLQYPLSWTFSNWYRQERKGYWVNMGPLFPLVYNTTNLLSTLPK
jgi:hypothetical protein